MALLRPGMVAGVTAGCSALAITPYDPRDPVPTAGEGRNGEEQGLRYHFTVDAATYRR